MGDDSRQRWQSAQEGEATWWAGVAATGYNGQNPEEFIARGQRESMLQALGFLGAAPEDFADAFVVEFGSGPAGIVEYLHSRRRIAIEPLYPKYREMYPHLASSGVEYISIPAESRSSLPDGCADLVVCYNMLDHVLDPEKVMEQVARVAKPGAQLLFQVNVYASPAEIAKKSGLHAELHPHSFTTQSAIAILEKYGFDVSNSHCSPVANDCGEHYFICACRKAEAAMPRQVANA